ncbi:Derlin [Trypanosoma melophagium]|uniref:Derlin n=1 Tax=Trypanosoma melophagium TaxID=715481 RepID=UPI00351A95E8|nr:Derlin [Trypanosoma melophagium]
MAQNFETWLNNLSPMTRYILGIAVFLTVVSSLGVVGGERLLLTQDVITHMQLWRPFTSAFFLGNFSANWPFSLAILIMYSNYNEKFDFMGKSGDFVWMWLFMITIVTVVGLFIGLYFTSFSLMMALCWVFCKRHPEMNLTLFVFEFRAAVFPWVLLLFHVIMGGAFMEDIVGIVIGHLYYFLKDVFPETHGMNPLRTPAWFLRLVMPNDMRTGLHVWSSGAYRPAGNSNSNNMNMMSGSSSYSTGSAGGSGSGSQHRWGKGRALGSS